MFLSNTYKQFVTMKEILTPISKDHSLVLFSLSKEKDCLSGKEFPKLYSSLTKDRNYIIEIKKLI